MTRVFDQYGEFLLITLLLAEILFLSREIKNIVEVFSLYIKFAAPPLGGIFALGKLRKTCYFHIPSNSNFPSSIQILYHPIKNCLCFSNNGSAAGFVKMSAGWSSDFIWCIVMLPLSTYSRKWCIFTLMCLVRGLILSLLAICMAPLLSSKTLQCTFVRL